MSKTQFFIGIDIASESFTSTVITKPDSIIDSKENITNSIDGFHQFITWLKENNISQSNSIICMESTGVYLENLCYFFHSEGFQITVAPPHKVKEATNDSPRKNDTLDSFRIAQYAYRYFDKLNLWKPKSEILEQIKALLSTREHLVVQKTGNINALKSHKRKHIQTPLVTKTYQSLIDELEENIKEIEKQIEELIKKDDSLKNSFIKSLSTPGAGMLLISNLMVMTNGFTEHLNYKQASSLIGICPYEKQSGSSLKLKPRSKRFGPARLRKLLYLAAMSVCKHNPMFRKYYLRKIAEGKPKRVVLNNIANKTLKIIFALVKSNKSFIPNYVPVNPVLLK